MTSSHPFTPPYSAAQGPLLDSEPLHQRRIRHITGIQVRNLTPFPFRDAVTSSLAQARTPPLHAVHLTDDVELALARRRSRRISTTSMGTMRSFRAEALEHNEDSPSRSHEISKSLSARRPSSSSRWLPPAASNTRARSSSQASAPFGRDGRVESQTTASPPLASYDGQQRSLEHVVSSRLVETFLALSLPFTDDLDFHSKRTPSPTTLRTSTVQATSPPIHKREASSSTNSSSSSKRPDPASRRPSSRESQPLSSITKSSHSSVPSISKPIPRRAVAPPAAAEPTQNALPTPAPSPPAVQKIEPPEVPFYISSFHRPSTNPSFTALDPTHDFAPWANLSEHRFRVFLWGRTNGDGEWGTSEITGKGKEKEIGVPSPESGWSVICEWDVDLGDLVPLSSEFAKQSQRLPSNTLIINIGSSGEAYYLPTRDSDDPCTRSSPPSPTTHSDGELEAEKWAISNNAVAKAKVDALTKNWGETKIKVVGLPQSRQGPKRSPSTKVKTAAPYGDLLNLVSLQAVLADTQEQLQEVQERCNAFIEEDAVGMLRREVSEREEQVRWLREQTGVVRARATSTAEEIERRRGLIYRRREILQQARALHERDQQALIDQQSEIDEERQKHAALIASLVPVRTTLLQTLSSIFPIEPLEPKDLLFTIVTVPLPVPFSSSEPAPPLSLPGQPSFNDETVASALGLVAQVIQTVSAYIGHTLTYPVTCIGSRSLIKDPISAMMGPRNFPLYLKGVDTYRFEYGVFLLNKNIEMLMCERNLRAIDLRHTLPNLHNLMLTVTSGRGADLKPRRRKRPRIPNMSSLSATSSTISASSTLASEASEASSPAITVPPTARDGEIIPTLPAEPSTPSPPPAERRSFYSPLAALLRARYPSVRATPLPSTGNGGPKPKSSLANEVRAASSDMGELSQSHGDTSESQTTSDEDDSSLADTAETATLRGTPTESRASREGSTSTVKAPIVVEAPEGTANEKTICSTSIPPKIIVRANT